MLRGSDAHERDNHTDRENAMAGEITVTFKAGRRSITLHSVRQDEYSVAVRLPEKMAPGPWRIDVHRKATNEAHQLPMTMVVQEGPAD